MRTLIAAAVLFLGAGCFVPRSASFGQTGRMLAGNEVEAAVTPGFAYQITNNPPQDLGNGQRLTSSTAGLTLPAFEGNVGVGLTEMLGLNIHMSPAGFQPGVKVGLVKGPVSFAIMPQLALGIWTQANSQTVNGTTTSSNPGTFYGLLGGLKAFASHESGVYGGLGYDIQIFNVPNSGAALGGNLGGGGGNTSTTATSHNIGLAAGYELTIGGLRIRPELAFMFAPALSVATSNGSTTVTQSGGSAVYVFPNVTFGAVTTRNFGTLGSTTP